MLLEWFMILERRVSNVTSLLPAKIKFKMPPMFINWDSWMALVVKNLPTNAGDIRDEDSVPGLGIFPGVGHSNPLKYSCLENLMERGVCKVAKSWKRLKKLSMHAHMCMNY